MVTALSPGGHYVAFAKNAPHNSWFEFNDTRVRPVSADTVLGAEGYVLFYRSVSTLTHAHTHPCILNTRTHPYTYTHIHTSDTSAHIPIHTHHTTHTTHTAHTTPHTPHTPHTHIPYTQHTPHTTHTLELGRYCILPYQYIAPKVLQYIDILRYNI